jgi:hypothetical protein
MHSKHQDRLRQVTHDAWEGVLYLQKELQLLEDRLDVGERWTPDSPEDKKASAYMQIRSYQWAVDKLEGLVVQRLFELTKANISGTGMYFSIDYLHVSLKCNFRIQTAHAHIKGPQSTICCNPVSPHGI